MDADKLLETDTLLQVVQLLRLREMGFARDRYGIVRYQADPDGVKLDWYTLGLLDGARTTQFRDLDRLRLLLYHDQLCRKGPGLATLKSVDDLLSLLDRSGPSRDIEAGRRAISEALAQVHAEPCGYASLLIADAGAVQLKNSTIS